MDDGRTAGDSGRYQKGGLIMANLLRMPPSTTYTPGQALQSALDDDLQDVLIVGYDRNGDIYIRSSRTTCAEAHFMANKAMRWAESGGEL